MTEFTGERVIPGKVSDDLWAEHVGRYAFAHRLAPGRRVLDLGCGTGYGTVGFTKRTREMVAGVDCSAEAIAYAAMNYPGPQFFRASATMLPFCENSFDLVSAFEVIEHLEDWPLMLAEAGRVLSPGGVFLVSTPNKLYYAESRAEHGPNPFHRREFEFEEFRTALTEVFPQVTIFLQNRLEAIAFYPADRYATTEALLAETSGTPAQANFFLAICSSEPVREMDALLYVPRAANLLREREHHIRLLESELAQNQRWLRDMVFDRDQLLEKHAELKQHLDRQNHWAMDLDRNWKAAMERIAQLQEELKNLCDGYARQVETLEEENVKKTTWALDTEARLTAELQSRVEELGKTVQLLNQAEETVAERTQWAQGLDRELQDSVRRLGQVRQSRWVRLGRAMGVGPRLATEDFKG